MADPIKAATAGHIKRWAVSPAKYEANGALKKDSMILIAIEVPARADTVKVLQKMARRDELVTVVIGKAQGDLIEDEEEEEPPAYGYESLTISNVDTGESVTLKPGELEGAVRRIRRRA